MKTLQNICFIHWQDFENLQNIQICVPKEVYKCQSNTVTKIPNRSGNQNKLTKSSHHKNIIFLFCINTDQHGLFCFKNSSCPAEYSIDLFHQYLYPSISLMLFSSLTFKTVSNLSTDFFCPQGSSQPQPYPHSWRSFPSCFRKRFLFIWLIFIFFFFRYR